MYVVGIDENGLGPRLGMFCVTAAVFECSSYDKNLFWKNASDGAVDDSKKVMASGRTGKGRRIAAAYLAQLGHFPETDADFIEFVNHRSAGSLSNDCPPCVRSMCRAGHSPFCEDSVSAVSDNLFSLLKDAGIRFAGAESVFLCPKEFNRGIDRFGSKMMLEFFIMEKFFRKYGAADTGRGETLFICGKLGGTKRYGRYFDYLKKYRVANLQEGTDSFYEFDGLGRIEFVKDGDALHLPVALASVFGKLVREIFMDSLNGYFGNLDKSLPVVSGYNDHLTREFIEKTVPVRRERGIPDICFLRKR
ncbi:MAG: hypothetical protein U9O97_03800 [Elusimicrobiota bacterium]|nr:hypothetical protein [Elusimicrobiota bacterium]